ncbi:MAG TPA: hypothetical protein ACQGQH_01160 [Xylella sp.]
MRISLCVNWRAWGCAIDIADEQPSCRRICWFIVRAVDLSAWHSPFRSTLVAERVASGVIIRAAATWCFLA